jgi:hypothetical protein
MQLNNASLPRQALRGETRYLTNTNTTTYTNADLDASINNYLDLFTTEILDSMDEWDYQGEIATTDLVASQQEYVFPTDILKIKRIEISYDGTKWYLANPMDINERGEATDTTSIANDFSTSDPFYDLMDNSLMLYPIPTSSVVGGLKIWYEKLQTHLSTDTDSPNFARPFHKGLCYGAAKDYFEKYLEKGNAQKLANATNQLELYIGRAKSFYRKKNQDRQYIVESSFADYEYGQN